MNIAVDMKPHHINGVDYYDVKQFCAATGRHASHISLLFNQGNKIRKLKGIRIGGKPMIRVTEVEDFPFNVRSRGA